MNMVSNSGWQHSKNARLRSISAGGQCGQPMTRGLKLLSEPMAGSPQLWTDRPVHSTLSERFLHSCHQVSMKPPSWHQYFEDCHDYYPGTHPALKMYARRRRQPLFFEKSAKTFSSRIACLVHFAVNNLNATGL